VVVSVTRSFGLPVTDLTAQDLRLDPIVIAPRGAKVTISAMSERQQGTYLVDVVPVPGATWLLGSYLFCLAVSSAGNQAQTVFTAFR
jgi:hypothetical protein